MKKTDQPKTNACRQLDGLGISYELRGYDVDESDLSLFPLHEVVSVSAGQRGLQIILAPDDYIRAVAASVAPISRDPT